MLGSSLSNSPPLPVQRLPHLVLVEVFKMMSTESMICLAQVSRKMKKVVKNNGKQKIALEYWEKNLDLMGIKRFNFDDSILNDEIFDFNEGMIIWKLGDVTVTRSNTWQDNMILWWKDGTKGFKAIISFLIETFEIEHISFEIETLDFEKTFDSIDFVIGKNIRIKDLFWGFINSSMSAEASGILRRAIEANNYVELDPNPNLHNQNFDGFKEPKMKKFQVFIVFIFPRLLHCEPIFAEDQRQKVQTKAVAHLIPHLISPSLFSHA